MIISSKKDLSKSVFNINGVELTMESSVKILDTEINNKLNFEKLIFNICKKVRNQLNAICRLQRFCGLNKKKQQQILSNIQNLITALLFLKSPKIKWKRFMKGVYSFYQMIT